MLAKTYQVVQLESKTDSPPDTRIVSRPVPETKLRMPPYSRTSSVSFFSTVENGRSQSPSWSWATHRFTTLDVLRRCVTMLESSWFIYLLIRQTLTQLKSFSPSSNALLDVTGATLKKTETKVLIPFLTGVLTRLEQEKRVLEAIFGTQACLLKIRILDILSGETIILSELSLVEPKKSATVGWMDG